MGKGTQVIAGIDFGSSHICVTIGEVVENPGLGPSLNIIGVGNRPSRGLKNGMVVNIEETVSAIQYAVAEAEHMAGVKVGEVYASLSGKHGQTINSGGTVTIMEGEVKPKDVERVVAQAQNISLLPEQQILHFLPQEFTVDAQGGIRNPVGISGTRLEVKAHIITINSTVEQNIVKCIHRAGIEAVALVIQPLACSEAVLTPEEKEVGIVLIDIGAGMTDCAVFYDGSLRETNPIPLGGFHLSHDVSSGLQVSMAEADGLKMRHGCALRDLVRDDEIIEIAGTSGRPSRPLSRKLLAQILEARSKEIFQLVKDMLERFEYTWRINSGAVITGGSASLPGMVEIAERSLGLPVRLGVPQGIGGLVDVVSSPMHATGVGLLLYGYKYGGKMQGLGGIKTTSQRVKRMVQGWMKEFF